MTTTLEGTDLQRRVMDALRWDASVDASEIGVAVHNGVVTLTGQVDTYPEVLRAAKVARGVFGARAVANDIELRRKADARRWPSDTEVAESIAKTLQWWVSLPKDRIHSSVKDGIVTLEGEVEWRYQADAAETAVRGIRGVTRVINSITVAPKVAAQDVAKKIESAFQRSAVLDARRITIATEGGTVHLRGTVHTWDERDTAEEVAWSAPGVRRVDNDLVVVP